MILMIGLATLPEAVARYQWHRRSRRDHRLPKKYLLGNRSRTGEGFHRHLPQNAPNYWIVLELSVSALNIGLDTMTEEGRRRRIIAYGVLLHKRGVEAQTMQVEAQVIRDGMIETEVTGTTQTEIEGETGTEVV
jgi:hypothetical protein